MRYAAELKAEIECDTQRSVNQLGGRIRKTWILEASIPPFFFAAEKALMQKFPLWAKWEIAGCCGLFADLSNVVLLGYAMFRIVICDDGALRGMA